MAKQEAYQGLARKWRPQCFEDLVGQESVAQSFQSALRQGRVVHGHLLTGPRGVGKTTSARILAKALNCAEGPTPTPCGKCRHCIDITAGNDMDVLEIDAASNTGVDNIRELRERVVQAPFAARYKVYIIDEVHMLSTGAFNALLKTLEEPPDCVVFIFATTELAKVPETIRSRCVVHTFRRLGSEDIARRLAQVAGGEGVQMDEATAREIYSLIARSVEGGMRDALVSFDQLIAMTDGQPTVEAAARLLGLSDQGSLTQTAGWLAEGQAAELLKLIEDLVDRGRSLERFVKGLIAYLRDLMLLQAGAGADLIGVTGESLERAREQARQIAPATLFNILNQLFELESKLKQSTQARFLIEFTFLRIAAVRPVVPIDDILRRVQALPEAALNAVASPSLTAPSVAGPPPVAVPPANPPARLELAPDPVQPTAAVVPVIPAVNPSTLTAVLSAPEPPARAAVMYDSAPPPVPLGEGSAAAGVAEVDRDEFLETLIPQLPDACRFLGRYLRQAASLRLEPTGLRLVWGEGAGLARKMFEKPENLRAIEAALSQIHGRPMRLHLEDTSPSGAPPESRPQPGPVAALLAPDPVRRSMMSGRDVESTDSELWPEPADEGASETAGEDEPLALESDTEDEDAVTPTLPVRPEPPARPLESAPVRSMVAEPASAPQAPPPDRRTALQKAQAIMQASEDAARRIKLVRDMFSGRLIDEEGQPLPI